MTLAQIGAILSLLVAFGVSQPTVDKVQGILNNTVPVTTQIPTFGSISQPVSQPVVQQQTPTCTPNLSVTATRLPPHSMVLIRADYTTGCPIDKSLLYTFTVKDTDKNTILERYTNTIADTPYPDTNRWHFEYSQVYYPQHIEVLFQVGSTTASTTVN